MPLKLIPPGGRKGNRFYIARGTVGDRSVEVSTKATDRASAQKFAKELERELIAAEPPRPGDDVTFATAADLYVAYRDPAKADRQRIDKLRTVLGKSRVREIRQLDLVNAADILCPEKSPATRNREVLRIAAAWDREHVAELVTEAVVLRALDEGIRFGSFRYALADEQFDAREMIRRAIEAALREMLK